MFHKMPFWAFLQFPFLSFPFYVLSNISPSTFSMCFSNGYTEVIGFWKKDYGDER